MPLQPGVACIRGRFSVAHSDTPSQGALIQGVRFVQMLRVPAMPASPRAEQLARMPDASIGFIQTRPRCSQGKPPTRSQSSIVASWEWAALQPGDCRTSGRHPALGMACWSEYLSMTMCRWTTLEGDCLSPKLVFSVRAGSFSQSPFYKRLLFHIALSAIRMPQSVWCSISTPGVSSMTVRGGVRRHR